MHLVGYLKRKEFEILKYLIIVGNSCEIPNENLPTTSLQLSCVRGYTVPFVTSDVAVSCLYKRRGRTMI